MTVSNSTDTNQASEVRKALKTAILSLRHAEIATRPSSIEDADKSFESAVQYISDFIRTEKLKLLAEVRERAIPNPTTPAGDNEFVPLDELTKLEAEL